MALSGHVRANGSLQPAGRPVMAMTGSPAARSASSAASASGVMAPSVVSVSSISVSTPRTWRHAPGGSWFRAIIMGKGQAAKGAQHIASV